MIRQVERELRPTPDYEEGDIVKVHFVDNGISTYRQAIFKAKNGKDRADVLLMMIGTRATFNVRLQDIEPV